MLFKNYLFYTLFSKRSTMQQKCLLDKHTLCWNDFEASPKATKHYLLLLGVVFM